MISIRTILVVSFFLFQGCGGLSKDGEFLAKVGNATLLNKDVSRSSEESPPKTPALVGQWVAEEILFANASSSGFNKDIVTSSSSERLHRRLFGQRYLQHLAGNNIAVSSEEVFSYYNKNIDSFKRTKSGAKIFHMFVESKSEADEIVRTLGGGGEKTKKNEFFLQNGLRPASVASGSLIPELEKALFSKKSKKQLLGPIKSSRGYHVLFVLERFNAGSIVPQEEVNDEVYQRIFQKKFSLESLRVLDSLRNHTPYIIN